LLVPDDDPLSDVSLACRYKFIDQLLANFWSAWSKDYLNKLSNRTRWYKVQPNVKVGDVVLVRIKDVKPGDWPLALVDEVFPGADGLVRKVVVKMGGKFYPRPITSLVLLPVEGSGDPSRGTVCDV